MFLSLVIMFPACVTDCLTVVAWEQEQAVPAEEQRMEDTIMRVEERVERLKQVVVEVTDVQPVLQEQPKITPREVEEDWHIPLEKETGTLSPPPPLSLFLPLQLSFFHMVPNR